MRFVSPETWGAICIVLGLVLLGGVMAFMLSHGLRWLTGPALGGLLLVLIGYEIVAQERPR